MVYTRYMAALEENYEEVGLESVDNEGKGDKEY